MTTIACPVHGAPGVDGDCPACDAADQDAAMDSDGVRCGFCGLVITEPSDHVPDCPNA